ncbi:MAG TPA: helix-turn-helix domain-containing protein [Ktedonobacterales bacterium]|jgi:transposase|nr:helix-turn-helix domain-containing protein [Ktedonobacterales bacterium]
MKPLDMPTLTAEQIDAVATLYQTTQNVRLRTRAQMVLLAAEQHRGVREIAAIAQESEGTVRCWLKRYSAHGIDGLQNQWASGAPAKVTPAYQDQLLQLVRRRPRSLDLPYSTWTLQRLADELAERTGIRVEKETVRVHLKAAEIVLSRPQHTISSPDPEYAVKKRRLKQPATN